MGDFEQSDSIERKEESTENELDPTILAGAQELAKAVARVEEANRKGSEAAGVLLAAQDTYKQTERELWESKRIRDELEPAFRNSVLEADLLPEAKVAILEEMQRDNTGPLTERLPEAAAEAIKKGTEFREALGEENLTLVIADNRVTLGLAAANGFTNDFYHYRLNFNESSVQVRHIKWLYRMDTFHASFTLETSSEIFRHDDFIHAVTHPDQLSTVDENEGIIVGTESVLEYVNDWLRDIDCEPELQVAIWLAARQQGVHLPELPEAVIARLVQWREHAIASLAKVAVDFADYKLDKIASNFPDLESQLASYEALIKPSFDSEDEYRQSFEKALEQIVQQRQEAVVKASQEANERLLQTAQAVVLSVMHETV